MNTLRLNSHGNDVRLLQRCLDYLKYPCGAFDGVYGPKVEDAVEKFQADHNLYADGIAGPITLGEINKLVPLGLRWTSDAFPVVLPMEPQTRLTWVKCPADPISGGYNNTTLRSDTAEAYKQLYATVHKFGGVVTSAGGKRSLDSEANPNRSKTSMHYVGRAFDMATGTGLQNPVKDPFLLERVGDTRFWTVWCKSTLPEAELVAACKAMGIRGGLLTIPAVHMTKGKILITPTNCLVFDFTAMAALFGFSRISSRKAFWDKGDAGAAEWWHFQWQTGLHQGVTSFGSELLMVYPLAEAQKFVYWSEAKNCVYGVSWA